MKNIVEIVDTIIKEADVNASEYTVADRLKDIHQTRLELATMMRQAGTDVQVEHAQAETLVAGDQSFTKDIPHGQLLRVEYKPTGSIDSQYRCLERRRDCQGNLCSVLLGRMKYTEDTLNVYIWEAWEGDLKLTFADDRITEWVEADYTTGTAEPTELKEVYRKLLFLAQVIRHAGYYSKERYDQLVIEYTELMKAFKTDLNLNTDGSFIMGGNQPKIT